MHFNLVWLELFVFVVYIWKKNKIIWQKVIVKVAATTKETSTRVYLDVEKKPRVGADGLFLH